MNLKTKNFKDLLSDESFSRSDSIILQDPRNMTKFNLSNFHHVKFSLKAVDEDEEKAGPMAKLKKVNHETRDTLAELERTYVARESEEKKADTPDKFNAATWSTGMSAASLTSTAFERVTSLQAARLDDEVVLFSRVKKKDLLEIVEEIIKIQPKQDKSSVKRTTSRPLRRRGQSRRRRWRRAWVTTWTVFRRGCAKSATLQTWN